VTGPTVRRPVPESEPEDTSGRRGCIVAGAALGVVAGVLFAFFLLPPLLHHYFGETEVRMGAVYSAGGKTIGVASQYSFEDNLRGQGYEVDLDVTTNTNWAPQPDDFQLELADGVRITAEPPLPDSPDTSLTFAAGVRRRLLLRFPAPGGPGQPIALDLSNPRVRFTLPPLNPP
jgi:hypothetical protein